MVQAAAQGIVDFDRAAPDDRWWWKRLSWILDDLEVEDRLRVLTARHSALCAALAAGPSADVANQLIDKIDGLTGVLEQALLPWEEGETRARLSRSAAGMSASWKRLYGDPSDPAVAAKIARTIRAIETGSWDEE